MIFVDTVIFKVTEIKKIEKMKTGAKVVTIYK